ncbi:MAG TPA: CHRD domain-containing protein [Longimicrobiales bacterium]|nr:CHRD domain-containing protein [Longimicrobiales bacterium]
MRTLPRFTGLLAGTLLLGCGRPDADPTTPRDVTIPVYAIHEADNFSAAPLRGENEVPPVDTKAVGQASFHLRNDGQTVDYVVTVSNMVGVTQSHIHIGPPGVNGPIVVFLFGLVPAGVDVTGLLAKGSFTQADLIPRPAIGFGGTLAELLAAMRSGNAYANVHTLAHPGGEIRAQIR